MTNTARQQLHFYNGVCHVFIESCLDVIAQAAETISHENPWDEPHPSRIARAGQWHVEIGHTITPRGLGATHAVSLLETLQLMEPVDHEAILARHEQVIQEIEDYRDPLIAQLDRSVAALNEHGEQYAGEVDGQRWHRGEVERLTSSVLTRMKRELAHVRELQEISRERD